MRLLCRGSWVCPHLASSDQETLLFNTVRLLSCCGVFRGNYCLADFRVWSYEAVERYVIAVHLAWAYVEEQLVRTRSAQVRCYGDVIRRHRDDHAAAWLRAAVEQGMISDN